MTVLCWDSCDRMSWNFVLERVFSKIGCEDLRRWIFSQMKMRIGLIVMHTEIKVSHSSYRRNAWCVRLWERSADNKGTQPSQHGDSFYSNFSSNRPFLQSWGDLVNRALFRTWNLEKRLYMNCCNTHDQPQGIAHVTSSKQSNFLKSLQNKFTMEWRFYEKCLSKSSKMGGAR